LNDQANLKKNKEKYGDEQVYVVPFITVSGIHDKFTRAKHTHDIWSKFDNIGKFIYRYDAEGNPSMQQLIPYILIQHPDGNKFYVAQRLAGEERLVNEISIGFGGHINPEDGAKDCLFKALIRELHEELFISPIGSAEFIGYVRDLNSSTSDHTGCVFIVKATDPVIKEHENLKGEWMTVDELEKNYFKFEGWARHIIDHLVTHDKKF
jgi:predicted NUDIX family phosphoesterase